MLFFYPLFPCVYAALMDKRIYSLSLAVFKKIENGVDGSGKSGIINSRGDTVQTPIKNRHHPIEHWYKNKDFSRRQKRILEALPGYGSQTTVKKREVSMMDLAALTEKTGDEFALFTRKGERLIIRGNNKRIPLEEDDLVNLNQAGYRWSGHTHPGRTDAALDVSQGDRDALGFFSQENCAVYNAHGRHSVFGRR